MSATASMPTRDASGVGANGHPRHLDTDGDDDSFGKSPSDSDNDAIPAFGASAGATDRQAILALVKRYYAIAAARDARRACSMLYSITVEVLIEEHHRGNGPRSLQGNTCPRIMAKLLRLRHRELVEDVAANRVIAVQVHGNRGMALMRFDTIRERRVVVHRVRNTWKMGVPLDDGAP